MLTLVATSIYIQWFSGRSQRRYALGLGVALGLAMLARTENVLLGAAFVIHALGKRRREACATLWPTIPVIAVLLAPWLLWQVKTFGAIEQSSGVATREFRIYGHLDSGGVPLWYPAVAWKTVSDVLEWLHRCALAQEFSPLGVFGKTLLGVETFLALIVLVSITAADVAGLRSYRLGALRPVLYYNVLHVLYYYWVAKTYRPWYPLSVVALVVLAGGVFIGQLPWRRAVAFGVAAVVGLQLMAFVTYLDRSARFETSRTSEYRIRWLEQHCGPRSRVGLMNAGKLAYLSGFRSQLTIVNLDGVVNNALLRAYRDGSFVAYYCENIDCALELPPAWVFRDRALRIAFDQFRQENILEVPTRPVPLYRFRCP